VIGFRLAQGYSPDTIHFFLFHAGRTAGDCKVLVLVASLVLVSSSVPSNPFIREKQEVQVVRCTEVVELEEGKVMTGQTNITRDTHITRLRNMNLVTLTVTTSNTGFRTGPLFQLRGRASLDVSKLVP